jgi:hypothetical protein
MLASTVNGKSACRPAASRSAATPAELHHFAESFPRLMRKMSEKLIEFLRENNALESYVSSLIARAR